ncbi:MAG TPA: hypothetical protein VEU47_13230 [Candidatus Cybelea sp.]|nr:hypothetical protein [Candidatus Cybelea sp.]
MLPFRCIALGFAAAILAWNTASPAAAAAKAGKEAPSCAAITFRPIASGMSDGEQDAGLYKSRFGKIEVRANVKGGEAQEYHMLFNGKPPTALSGPVPKAAEDCLRTKHVAVPVKQMQGACLGTRFRVVVHHEGADRVAMFFALKGSEWNLCSASKL